MLPLQGFHGGYGSRSVEASLSIYVGPKPKEHGLGNQIEGFCEVKEKKLWYHRRSHFHRQKQPFGSGSFAADLQIDRACFNFLIMDLGEARDSFEKAKNKLPIPY